MTPSFPPDQQPEAAQLYLAALVASSEDAILSKDLDGIITSWNAAAERMYGYQAQEMIGQPVSLLFPPDRAQELAQIMERLRQGERIEPYETLRVRMDGSLVPVSVSISPIKDRRGTIIGASAIARDISKQKALEKQREAFVGLVTHELKNPLTAVQGSIQLTRRLLTRLLDQTSPQQQEQRLLLDNALSLLGRSLHSLRVQNRLVDDLLDFSRLQEDKLTLHLAACNLVEVVEETIQDYQAAFPSRSLLLGVPPDMPILVHADRDRLQQVLSNYLTNALKFSLASEPVQVGITLEPETAQVWVQDHGPGIAAEQQAHIWQRLYQVSQPLLQQGTSEGLGLGLYISHQLIRRHLGHVGMESAPGQGARFWFTLPLLSFSCNQQDAPSQEPT
ncbi:MAG TPA: PAS domain S-box protein [Ktedonobacteraceae bacterium]